VRPIRTLVAPIFRPLAGRPAITPPEHTKTSYMTYAISEGWR
jgi:hypothetical protein